MRETDIDRRLGEEVARAASETRAAMRSMATRCELPHPLMSLSLLIDRTKLAVGRWEGDASFSLDEETATVTFNAETLLHVLSESTSLAEEVGYEDHEECVRVTQLALNLFVVHEMIHVVQNFPDFGSVSAVKGGLQNIGLPMLDVAADVVSAWVCANVECERLNQSGKDEILATYSTMLVLAYCVGAFVFDVRERAPKIQRALGLLVSALLVQAKLSGTLAEDRVYAGWTPQSPVYVLDGEKTGLLNAMVIDRVPGMLVDNYLPANVAGVQRLWKSVGYKPVGATIVMLGAELIRIGLIKPA